MTWLLNSRWLQPDWASVVEGNPASPAFYGMGPGRPQEALVTVKFAEYHGKTKLTLRHSILESVKEREGTQQGWTEMLDRLAEMLAVGKGGSQ